MLCVGVDVRDGRKKKGKTVSAFHPSDAFVCLTSDSETDLHTERLITGMRLPGKGHLPLCIFSKYSFF